MISATGKVVVLIFNILKPIDTFDLSILFLLNPGREVNFCLRIDVNTIRLFRKDE